MLKDLARDELRAARDMTQQQAREAGLEARCRRGRPPH